MPSSLEADQRVSNTYTNALFYTTYLAVIMLPQLHSSGARVYQSKNSHNSNNNNNDN